MRPLRVLHVIPSVSPSDGGPATAIAGMERGLSEAGIHVTTLTTDHGLASGPLGSDRLPPEANGARRIYARKWTAAYKFAPGITAHLARSIRSYDVVHIHALFSFAATAAAWAAQSFGVPYIVRPLGTLSTYGMTMRRRRLKRLSVACVERRILRKAAAVHFTSRAELDEAEGLGLAFRGVVIPLGVGQAEAAPATAPQRAPSAPTGRRAILFLSRLDPKKNVEALIDAIAASEAMKASSTLLIAGSGEPSYVAALKERASRRGVAEHVVWLGHVEGVQKNAAFAAADIFVLPSYSENFGMAAAEALLAGLPCVLGRGVAIAEEVERSGAGIAAAPDTDAIRHALERMLGDPGLMQRMGFEARALAEREYSVHAMAQRLIALYEEVCATHRSNAA